MTRKEYDAWSEKTDCDWQVMVGRSSQRCGWTLLGHKVFTDTHIPWSCFKKISSWSTCADILCAETSPEMDIARKLGGTWGQDPYGPEEIGSPIFFETEDGDDCTWLAAQFLTELAKYREARDTTESPKA